MRTIFAKGDNYLSAKDVKKKPKAYSKIAVSPTQFFTRW